MASKSFSSTAARAALRRIHSPVGAVHTTRPTVLASISVLSQRTVSRTRLAAFSAVAPVRKGIMPDTDNPDNHPAAQAKVVRTQVELSESEYHALADSYLENLVTVFEDLQDEKEGIDVEFAAGVLNISFPEKGTYVINKQPPNKQIWLSSPLSGPKRYDWFVIGDSQTEKEGTAGGNWVYARDGSTLDELFLQELGVDLSLPPSHHGE